MVTRSPALVVASAAQLAGDVAAILFSSWSVFAFVTPRGALICDSHPVHNFFVETGKHRHKFLQRVIFPHHLKKLFVCPFL